MSAAATIADIARQAGVGTATVDRVLNQRPGVNAETVQRVMQVVAELGAPPQRGRPRKGENFRFAFVLPAEASPFAELVDRQIAQAAGEFRHQHITEVTHRIDSGDVALFAAGLAQLADCDAVAVMAPDLPPVKLAINELVRTGVHVVTLFSDVAGSMRETHVGADNRAAGRTAGLLLGRMAGGGNRDTLLLSSQATRLSARSSGASASRRPSRNAFRSSRCSARPTCPAGDAGACRALLRYLRSKSIDTTRVAGIYNVGSGSAGVARAVESLGLTGSVGVVAHDFTDEHRALLGANGLAYVLHQDIHYCISTAARVLRALCENMRGALNVVQPRVEILTAENLH